MPGGQPCSRWPRALRRDEAWKAFATLRVKPGPQKPMASSLVMHLPFTLVCPLPQPDFDVLVMGTQLSVSGTGFVPGGQPCGASFTVMRLQRPFTSLKPSSQPVTFFVTVLAGAV